ncbi:MAG: hypothetical protein PHT04_07100 [Eubacteriales bacterium]|nr:hypothetical protein [Eubacteriales bacterium]
MSDINTQIRDQPAGRFIRLNVDEQLGFITCSHEGIGVQLYPRIIASILWIHVLMDGPSIVSGYLMCRSPMTL